MRAMILSAGYGTRLWPLTEDRTKPAIPILGKPLVGYVAEYLAQYGCDDIIVNLHHRPESVRDALGDGGKFGVRLRYIEEPKILGTSGAVDNAREFLRDDTFVVVNGKIITDIDLAAAIEMHRSTQALATLVTLPNFGCERFSIVEAEDNCLRGFGGMPVKSNFEGKPPPLMFTGIQIFEPRVLDFIPRGKFSDSVTDVFPQALEKGERIGVHIASGSWYELSTLQRYRDICLMLLDQSGRSVSVGEGCNISPDAEVSRSIIWDDVTIEPGSRVNRAVLGDNVKIRAGEEIEDAVVVCASLVRDQTPPPKAAKGEFQGDNFVVPLSR